MVTNKQPFFDLSKQFASASFAILLAGMLLLGWWVGRVIQEAVFRQATEVTSAYIDSFVAPYIASYLSNGYVSPAMSNRFTQELGAANFGHQVVSVKIWDRNGYILFSSVPGLTGQKFPVDNKLQQAFSGLVVAHLTSLGKDEHVFERMYWDELIEIYAPVYAPGSRDIIAVAEYYLPSDALEDEMRRARQHSWIIVGGATFIMYVVLNTLVTRGNFIIQEQAEQLQTQIHALEQLLEQNRRLHTRIQRAARRTVALNERYLRRISSELHDGPLQMLAVAALQLDDIATELQANPATLQKGKQLEMIQDYLQDAMREMRQLAAGLRLPQTAQMTLFEVVEYAVSRHKRRTQTSVQLEVDDLPPEESLAPEVKIAIYRITEEALNNAYKHAAGQGQRVYLGLETPSSPHAPSWLRLEISDQGPGIVGESAANTTQHLGIIGMRERAESLGGSFEIRSAPGKGTTILVRLPLKYLEDESNV